METSLFNFRAIAITACLALLFNTSACVSKSMNCLTLQMTIDQSELSSGLVLLESKLSSPFDKNIRVLPWNTPFDSSVNGRFLSVYDISKVDPTELPYIGRMVKRAAPQPGDYILLTPDEPLSNTLDITNSYDFCRNRRYIIEFKGAFYAPDGVEYAASSESIEFTSSAEFPRCQN